MDGLAEGVWTIVFEPFGEVIELIILSSVLQQKRGSKIAEIHRPKVIICAILGQLWNSCARSVFKLSLMKNSLGTKIHYVVDILRHGGVVALPTDTIYGLGADISNDIAIERVFSIKGRLTTKALPVLVAGIEQALQITSCVPNVGLALMKAFWPGSLTLICKKSSNVSDKLTGSMSSIAIRHPNHPIPLEIINQLGSPITGTSANRSGQPTPFSSNQIIQLLGADVNYVIPGSCHENSLGSTIIDISIEQPAIVRTGSIPVQELTAIMQTAREDNGH